MSKPVRVAVAGGGIMGLSSCRYLLGRGCEVVILDQFHLGTDRGSSHGASRIFRSSYSSPVYVDLLRPATLEEWPRLEKEAGIRLVHPRPACFFGLPGGPFDEMARTMDASGCDTDLLSPTQAARRFPQFCFHATEAAILDRTAGVIAAADTMEALRRLCVRGGAEIREETTVVGLEPAGDRVRVVCPPESLEVDRVIVAAGAWTSRLLPFLGPRLSVARQNVGYFPLPGGGEDEFPIWAWIGREPHDFYYGLPAFGRAGIKAARHWTGGGKDDPDRDPGPSPSALEDLERFLEERLAVEVGPRMGAETCLYTNTPTEDFVIDLHPHDPRIVLAAGFSGHGFKFGPVVGRILAELALDGGTGVAEFNRHRDVFSIRGRR